MSLDLELLVSCFSFDIHCWWWNPKYDPLLQVRLLRTNLREKDVQPVKEQLAQSLFDHIPVSRIGRMCKSGSLLIILKVTGRGWQQGNHSNGCQGLGGGLGDGDGLELKVGS